MKLSTIDTVIVAIYAVSIFVLAQWVSRERNPQLAVDATQRNQIRPLKVR